MISDGETTECNLYTDFKMRIYREKVITVTDIYIIILKNRKVKHQNHLHKFIISPHFVVPGDSYSSMNLNKEIVTPTTVTTF